MSDDWAEQNQRQQEETRRRLEEQQRQRQQADDASRLQREAAQQPWSPPPTQPSYSEIFQENTHQGAAGAPFQIADDNAYAWQIQQENERQRQFEEELRRRQEDEERQRDVQRQQEEALRQMPRAPHGGHYSVRPDGRPAVEVWESTCARVDEPGDVAASARPDAENQNSLLGALGEDRAYKQALVDGEIGLQAPGRATERGPDFITAGVQDGRLCIYVNDAKTSEVGLFPPPVDQMRPDWYREAAAAATRVDLGNPQLEAQVREALARGDVYLRQVNVDRTTPNMDATPRPPYRWGA